MICVTHANGKVFKISIVNKDRTIDFSSPLKDDLLTLHNKRTNEDIFHEAYLFCYVLSNYDAPKLNANN